MISSNSFLICTIQRQNNTYQSLWHTGWKKNRSNLNNCALIYHGLNVNDSTSHFKYIYISFLVLAKMISLHQKWGQDVAPCKSIHSWCDASSDRSFMVDSLSYFSFQSVLHDWCNKGHGMCYPVCGMMHIKEPLLLNGKSSPSECSFTICVTP